MNQKLNFFWELFRKNGKQESVMSSFYYNLFKQIPGGG